MQRGFPFISFAIMVQNEEKILKPLLEQLADFSKQYHNSEIVIVDGGSNDATIELASKYVPMEKIFVRQFENDFSDQRNFLTSLCPHALATTLIKSLEAVKKLNNCFADNSI